MTISRLDPAHPAPTLASAIGAIRARGLRVSTTRRLILEALFAEQAPVSAEALAAGSPRATSARSTATSSGSRRSGSCATCTSATGRACMRWRRAPISSSSRASAAAASRPSTPRGSTPRAA